MAASLIATWNADILLAVAGDEMPRFGADAEIADDVPDKEPRAGVWCRGFGAPFQSK